VDHKQVRLGPTLISGLTFAKLDNILQMSIIDNSSSGDMQSDPKEQATTKLLKYRIISY